MAAPTYGQLMAQAQDALSKAQALGQVSSWQVLVTGSAMDKPQSRVVFIEGAQPPHDGHLAEALDIDPVLLALGEVRVDVLPLDLAALVSASSVIWQPRAEAAQDEAEALHPALCAPGGLS